jgi:SAM-dependent methyltransferase
MFAYTKKTLEEAELVARDGSIADALKVLRKLPLAYFGEIMWMLPAETYPHLSTLLPKMADVSVQNAWTGTNGYTLLVQTTDFIRTLACACLRLAGRDLRGAPVLDYGCGYGRMIRLMYYFTDPNSLWGLDPSDEAIRICRSDRLAGNFGVTDYLPSTLPVEDCMFDVAYAFSVFTHTSERATRTALKSLRKYISPSGLLALTIRPREYWASQPRYQEQSAEFERLHDSMGFSFSPHGREAIDGDVTFGDTSMTLEWLQANAPDWKIAGFDRNLGDPHQQIVFMRPQ